MKKALAPITSYSYLMRSHGLNGVQSLRFVSKKNDRHFYLFRIFNDCILVHVFDEMWDRSEYGAVSRSVKTLKSLDEVGYGSGLGRDTKAAEYLRHDGVSLSEVNGIIKALKSL